MGLGKTIPVYLDKRSGFNKNQIDTVNAIARTTRRNFELKATQKQLDKPLVQRFLYKSTNRILDLRDYIYTDTFSISFILDPTGFEVDGRYLLFTTKYPVKSIFYEGSYDEFDVNLNYMFSNMVSLEIDKVSGEYMFYVKVRQNWPVDTHGNKVQYNIFLGGRVYD